MPNPGDIYYALDTNKTYVSVNGQWVLQSPEFTGDVLIAQSTTTTTLANVMPAPGTYGSGSLVPVLTVDSKGRITSAFSTPLNIPPPTAGGPNLSVQFNDSGFFNGSNTFTFDPATDTVGIQDALITNEIQFVNPTPTFNNLTPQTTAGDLIAYDGTDAVRFPVGSNDQVLAADNTVPTGLKWVTIPASQTNVPYYVPPATTYLLPEYYQANFILPIEVDGDIEIDGYLIELANQ